MRSMAYEGVGSLKRYIDHPIDCRDNANETTEINLKLRNQMFHLIDLLNGSVKIEFEEIPDDQVLLTFASGQTNKDVIINDIDCWTTDSKSMVVSNLIENETQTFCLMDKGDQTVSPLDCLSILPRNSLYDPASDAVWLTEDDKLLAIGLLVMGLIICLVIGFGIGMWIVKRQSIARNNRKQSISSRPDMMPPDWKHYNRNEDFPYTDNDNVSIASDRSSYVMAVNPSRFDLIKMKLEKSENPTVHESGNLYDLEDMPYSKVFYLFLVNL